MKLFAKFQQVTQAELFFSSGPVLTLGRFPWLSIRGCSFPLFFPPRDKQIKDTLNCCCFLRSLCGTAGAFGRETKSACVCVCLTTLSSRMWKPRSPKSPEIHWRFVISFTPTMESGRRRSGQRSNPLSNESTVGETGFQTQITRTVHRKASLEVIRKWGFKARQN